MTYGYVATFDGNSSASAVPELIIQRVGRPFMGDVRDVYVEIPGAESSWVFTEEAGDASVTMQCILVGEDGPARRASVRKLAGWVKSSRRRPLIISDEPDRLWWAKLSERPDVEEALLTGKLVLNWRCKPYAESVAISETTVAVASTGVNYTFNVPADPGVEIAPIIEITPGSTLGAGFDLRLNGVRLDYAGSIAGGTTRTVSSPSFTVTSGANANSELATGEFPVDDLNMVTVTGDFGVLKPGGNIIRSERGTFSARIVWRRKFV